MDSSVVAVGSSFAIQSENCHRYPVLRHRELPCLKKGDEPPMYSLGQNAGKYSTR